MGEFQIEELNRSVAGFRKILAEARESYGRSGKGRPKQNHNLERLISNIGQLFKMATGNEPLKTYRYDALQQRHEYQGPFFDFFFEIVWKFNDTEVPSNNSVGEAARRIFDRR